MSENGSSVGIPYPNGKTAPLVPFHRRVLPQAQELLFEQSLVLAIPTLPASTKKAQRQEAPPGLQAGWCG